MLVLPALPLRKKTAPNYIHTHTHTHSLSLSLSLTHITIIYIYIYINGGATALLNLLAGSSACGRRATCFIQWGGASGREPPRVMLTRLAYCTCVCWSPKKYPGLCKRVLCIRPLRGSSTSPSSAMPLPPTRPGACPASRARIHTQPLTHSHSRHTHTHSRSRHTHTHPHTHSHTSTFSASARTRTHTYTHIHTYTHLCLLNVYVYCSRV